METVIKQHTTVKSSPNKNNTPFIGKQTIQRKLSIGSPNDVYEQEADAMADQVVNRSDPQINTTSNSGPLVQRKCADCEEDMLQKKSLASEITPLVQRKGQGTEAHSASQALTQQIQSSQGGGHVMDKSTQNFMESRFGKDFSGVRIHTDSQASQMGQELNAQAFTVGNDIYFNEGRYNPNSNSGKHLLAHELTHTVQQKKSEQINRKIKVEKSRELTMGSSKVTNREEANQQFNSLNPHFKVNDSGEVEANSFSCPVNFTPIELRDKCLCDMISTQNVWKIKINNNEWPHVNRKDKSISIHNRFSGFEFGSWGANAWANTRIMQSLPRVLGHELCGHAYLIEQKVHPKAHKNQSQAFGRPSHDRTIEIENIIADEMAGANAPDRGLHKDNHQGESFAKITLPNYAMSGVTILGNDNHEKLKKMKEFLKNEHRLKVDIFGHSDSKGSKTAKLNVSLRRAIKLREKLKSMGVNANQIKTVKGLSDTKCKSKKADPSCRKVEAFVYIFDASRQH